VRGIAQLRQRRRQQRQSVCSHHRPRRGASADYEIKVGLDILHNDPTGLAQDARAAHDVFMNAKTDIIAAGNNVSDNDRLGGAELQMDDAINELKNGMGAVVAFAENPNAGTLGAANSKLDQGITDWDQAATVLWTMAGRASEVPNLAGSGQTTTQTTPSAPAPPAQSAPTAPTPTPATCSLDTSPGGPLESDANGILIKAKQGQYGPACQQVANHLIATDPAAAQAYGEDTACGGQGPGSCGPSQPTTHTTTPTAPAPPPPPSPSNLPRTSRPPCGRTTRTLPVRRGLWR
jgi:hypothetical protein